MPPKHWSASERITAFKEKKGFRDNLELHTYFNQRLSKIVTGHGRQMVGWDEILHPGLPKDTVVHSWRGQESLGAAVKQGFRGILSFGYYLDLIWPAAEHYAVDPFDKGVDRLLEADRARVLGGEACLWSEYVTPETLDSRLWPRTAAIAERLWSPREVKDVADMYLRLDAASRWLEWLGLDHQAGYGRMLERLAGREADDLRALADVVEPVKNYEREDTHEYTTSTPLNRLVDVTRPESEAARSLGRAVDTMLADPAHQAGREAIRARLRDWRDLGVGLRSLLEGRALLRELVPLAIEASALAGAGLEALGFLEQGQFAPDSWWKERAALLQRPKSPPHGLEVAFRPAVGKLVEAARGATASTAGSR